MFSKKTILSALLAAGTWMLAGPAAAAVSADEAKALGTTLTEFGAEKGGSADGTIPPYSGGLDKVPGYDPNTSQRYIDPFKDEKPLYSINAQNAAQYSAELTEGSKAMLARFPTFRIDVFPTRRTVRYPSYVLQNTIKNATTAKLHGEIEGDGVAGADKGNLPFPGIPFPIPKNGYEVMWNHQFHYGPAIDHNASGAWLIDSASNISPLPETNQYFLKPWYDKAGKLRSQTFDAVFGFSAQLTSPPSSAGIVFLNYYLADASEGGQKVWFYTPGQRRVRLAPEFAYDVPIASYGGVLVWDEIFGLVGRMDRFNFKLVGKKDMIVPYNVFGITNTQLSKDFLGPKHVNPSAVRWEKRRIWVVDATRKPEARHAYSRRTFYVEEDCWCIVATESYDNGGKLWRVANLYNFPTYDVGGVNNASWSFNDLNKGNYFVINSGRNEGGHFVRSHDSSEGIKMNLTPQAVAGGGVR